ncbi:MAG: metallophosphoesterase [Myxococcota bacterium]|nr:metallophosphoesterase [Myxococcota bacterium]
MLERVDLDQAAVIGDIHGRLDLLERLLDRLDGRQVVIAGDVCDRGNDTARCVELLIRHDAIGVRGNHEQWLINWIDGRGFDRGALSPRMGGDATLLSYGVDPRQIELDDAYTAVPAKHQEWLRALPIVLDLWVDGSPYWLIHAGIPGFLSFGGLLAEEVVPHLLDKHPDALLWSKTDPDLMPWVDRPVILGHVAQREPYDDGRVIAVDTGAGRWSDGTLSAVLLPERRFVTVEP